MLRPVETVLHPKENIRLMFNKQKKTTAIKNSDHWLLHRQLSAVCKNVPASGAANILNGTITVVLFSNQIDPFLLMLGFSILLALVGWRFGIAHELKTLVAKGNRLRVLSRKVNANAAAMGGFWGLTIGALFPLSSPSELLYLGIIGAGMTASGSITFRAREKAALLYVGCAVPGSMVGLLSVGTSASYAAAGLLAAFTVVLTMSIRGAASDISQSHAREREVQDAGETIRMLLNEHTEHGSDWLFELNHEGQIMTPCTRFADATQRPIETLDGKEFVTLFDAAPECLQLARSIRNASAFRHIVVSFVIGGEKRWWSISARPIRNEDAAFRGIISDITAQRQAEAKVSYMAMYDGLTDLPNRFHFNERLYHALNRDGGAGLMYLDLDHFKAVNDTLGHPVGDKLLKAVARILETAAHPEDLVARLGGDEFAIMVPVARIDRMDALAMDIIGLLRQPISLGDHDVVVGTTIGLVAAPAQAADVETMFRNADLALYAAKEQGRNCALWFDPAMDEAAQERRQIELDLRNALNNDELRLYYQPMLSVDTGAVTAHEALIRWEQPNRGIVMPDRFIPIAEETGLILQIGEWVIRQAIDDLSQWPAHEGVSINLSPAQMRSPTLVTTIVAALARTGVAADRICFEITESVLLQDSETNIETLHKLRSLGIRIALDDFGTGFSSLNYLRSFPFDKIKIDRAFVADIDTREDCRAIVQSVVDLARALNMTTVAEGVERIEQVEHLRAAGCQEVQGYLFSQAVPNGELTDLRGGVQRTNNVFHIAAKDQKIFSNRVGKRAGIL
jgi:diguanylate cyclase (GGDEF)-like protein